MDGVNAAHADWGGASLRTVSLSGARLEGAILDTCDLQVPYRVTSLIRNCPFPRSLQQAYG